MTQPHEIRHSPETGEVLELPRLTPERLREEFLRQAEVSPNDDPYIKAFSAAYDAVYDEPEIRDLIDFFLHVRQTRSNMLPWHAHNHLFRAYQAQMISHEDELGYPQNFSHPENWVPHIIGITRHMDVSFETDLWVHSVQSNVSGRYRSMAMVLDALADRYPKQNRLQTISALDVGCSLHRGYSHLASDIPFSPIVEATNAHLPTVNRSIQSRINFVDSLGVDLKSLNNEDTRRWAESCSMYPRERQNKSLVGTYEALDKFKPPGVEFEDADFTETGPEGKWDPRGRMHPSRIHRYDVVSMYTFLYQLSTEQQKLAFQHAQYAVKEDGIILVQDFMDTHGKDTHSMAFSSPTQPWTYRTFALDMLQPEKGLQPLFTWVNGRCEKLTLPLDRSDSSMDLQTKVFESLIA